MDVEKSLQALKDRGYKYTGKREDMIRVFDRHDRYLSAKDVFQLMQDDYPTLSYDTIYRNLSLFEELEIVEGTELNGERKYRLTCATDGHHHHLICLSCGTTRHIRSCPMEAIKKEEDSFTIIDHKFEIYGYCAACERD